MTKVTIDETTYSVTVAEENVNVTVADATETIQIQIASGASDTQVLSSGGGNSLVVGSTGGITTLKSLSAGDNVTFSDDGNTITISSEDDLSNNTTDDLAEGTTNLYYTDARVDTSLASVTGNIIPSVTDTYTLGSPTHVWQDLYLGQASLYIDGTRVIGSDVTGDINITTDPNQNIHIAAGQNVVFQSVVGATDQTFEVELDTINLGQDVGGATVTVRGTLEAPDIHVGNLELDSSGIQQTQVGQNLTLKTSGNGFVYVETADFYVGDVNTSAVKIDENSISRFGGGIVTIDGFTNSADMTTAINTAETNANTYTDTREIAITTAYQAYADQSEADAITTSNSYADTAIANLVDSAPATLDTLNELAAALGDDPNFATTITNSIATKWTQDNTKISNWDTAYSWGDHSIVGYLTDYTVTEADVTQHQAALSITESQISDLTHYTDSDARTAISLTSSNLNELSYDSLTGVFTYVSPTTVTSVGQVTFDVRNTSGVDIARGDAVYIAGHSGGKVLVAKADANAAGEHPAFGLANSAMLNNSDGTVLTHGEMLNVDTSAFAVNDTLYLSETAGELTATRPSSETTAVQNIGKVARSDNQNGIIVVAGSGRENDVPNLATGHVFIGNGTGYDTRALTTSDVSEGSNLYYTDGRVQTWFGTVGLGMLSTDVVAEGSNKYFTDARAITAIESATDLDLNSTVTIEGSVASKSTVIGDSTVGGVYDTHGFTVNAGDTAWAGINLVEHSGSNKPIPNFTNPAFSTTIFGGTVASPAAVSNGQRVWSSFALTSPDGNTPQFANFRMLGTTTENQSLTNRGVKFSVETTANGSNSTIETLVLQGDTLTVNSGGDGKITTGGNLILDDDVTVTGDLEVQGKAVTNLNPFLLGGM